MRFLESVDTPIFFVHRQMNNLSLLCGQFHSQISPRSKIKWSDHLAQGTNLLRAGNYFEQRD